MHEVGELVPRIELDHFGVVWHRFLVALHTHQLVRQLEMRLLSLRVRFQSRSVTLDRFLAFAPPGMNETDVVVRSAVRWGEPKRFLILF